MHRSILEFCILEWGMVMPTGVIPVPEKWKQEDQELKIILRYIVSSKPAKLPQILSYKNKKGGIWGGDGLVGRTLATQAKGPGFESPESM